MSVTPAEKLSGLLPAIVTGGRPSIFERLTARLLAPLHGVTADPVWIVRDDQAGDYQPDGHEIITYPRDWAREWAAAHWTDVKPMPEDGSFLGAFPGREHAARVAEERGYWGVLQLDDNIRQLTLFVGTATSKRVAERHGGLAMFADILAAVSLSTNAAMCGAHLQAVNPAEEMNQFARTGFPYSLFIERTGPGREPWHGPAEDDIIHALQYGSSAAAVTSAVVPPLRYQKEHTSRTGGFRTWYDPTRSAGLQRLFPEVTRISVQRTTANGRGEPRVFHSMTPDAIRTPLTVTDPALYEAARQRLKGIAAEIAEARREDIKELLDKRAASAVRREAATRRRLSTTYRER